MASSVYGVPLEVIEGETRTLSTSPDYIAIQPNFREVKLYCATQWRLSLSPALLHCLYYNGTSHTYTEYKPMATDKDSSTHVPLDAMATTDYIYLGFSDPALGVYLDMGSNVNSTVTTLDVEYCSTAVSSGVAIAFTDVAGDSDGTSSGGATLAIDGVYMWTLPTAWKDSTLGTYATPLYDKCYWLRFKPLNDLSATVDINEIIPVYKNVNYGYMEAGMEYQFAFNTTKCGGFVVKATAATPTLDISWVRH